MIPVHPFPDDESSPAQGIAVRYLSFEQLLGVGRAPHVTGQWLVEVLIVEVLKVEALEGEGPKFAILSALAERGPSTLQEIAAECGLSRDKCKFVLKSELIPQNFVQVMKGSPGEQ